MKLDLLWWVGWALVAGLIALPLLAIPLLGPVMGFAAWAVLAPWTALLGLVAVHRAFPRSEPGTFRLPGDVGSLRWALKGWAPAVYLTLFQPVFFASPGFQRLVLRGFGAHLGTGAWLTSRTVVREPHHLSVGARSLVGEYAHLACSFQPRPGMLVVAPIVIGDDTLVSAHCHIGPGASVGSRCILEHAVVVGPSVVIGDDSRIGAGTAIYRSARIGRGVSIGKHCVIPSGCRIADGQRIPDGTTLAASEPSRKAEVLS
jgi:UDP-3-O-[3-hydroxymyristoyl] glucosamine N-acyltransferase